MQIRRIEIERFRGIKKLDWTLKGECVCLVGPGDSTKTTILDAIDLALSPRWRIPFYDTDFYDADLAEPIKITITVSQLPEEFKSASKYGYVTRGWTVEGGIRDEPADGDELALSIRLEVDSSLEPSWKVINDRNAEGENIKSVDREKLGCVRLRECFDRDFSWGRGSILSRLTAEPDNLSDILADAGRAARSALAGCRENTLTNITNAAAESKRVGAKFGVAARSDYRPHLDVHAVSVGVGALSLHDGEIPIAQAGLGSRRLLALAMQRAVAKKTGAILVDEIEHGLEPHRVRRLLRVLRDSSSPSERSHIIMTTHSPTVIEELSTSELCVVRADAGVVELLPVDEALRGIVLKASEALLARKVLVCEGRTELGFCRRLDQHWSKEGSSFALAGIALADGGGSEAANVTDKLASLRYEVAMFGDSDRKLSPDENTLRENGASIILWGEGKAIEERLVADLPWDGVVAMVRLAMDEWGLESVRDAVKNQLNNCSIELTDEPSDWLGDGREEAELRKAIGRAAKVHKTSNRKGWFKRVDLAEELAGIVIQYWLEVQDKDCGKKIEELRKWAHPDE